MVMQFLEIDLLFHFINFVANFALNTAQNCLVFRMELEALKSNAISNLNSLMKNEPNISTGLAAIKTLLKTLEISKGSVIYKNIELLYECCLSYYCN